MEDLPEKVTLSRSQIEALRHLILSLEDPNDGWVLIGEEGGASFDYYKERVPSLTQNEFMELIRLFPFRQPEPIIINEEDLQDFDDDDDEDENEASDSDMQRLN